MPDNSANKRIAKNTLMLYFRMILIMGVTLYTSRVVLEVLGVEDFGIYNVVGGVVVMFGFLNSGMSSATQRFLSFELGRKDYEQLKKIFSLSVTIHALIGVAIFILAETIGLWFLNTQLTISSERMEAANWVYQFSIFAFIVNVMAVPYNAAIISHERMNVYAYVSILEVILKLAIVFLLQNFGFDKLKIYAVLVFAVSFIIRVVYQIYCKQKFEECRWRFVWDKTKFKEMFGFAGWNLFGELSWMARSQGTNMLLNIFFGPIVNAARGIAIQLDGALETFVGNFQVALKPGIIKAYAQHDIERVQMLSYQGGRYSFYLLFLLSVPVLFQTEEILSVWLKNIPVDTVLFVQLLLLNGLLNSYTKPLIIIAHASGKIKLFQIINGGWLLLALPVIYILFKFGFSPDSAFIVLAAFTFISSILRFVIVLYLVPKLSLERYIFDVIANIFLVSVCTLMPCYIISDYLTIPSLLLSIILRTFILGVITSLAIWIVGLNREEKKLIVSYLKIRIFKKK